jgi:hypothetical protein
MLSISVPSRSHRRALGNGSRDEPGKRATPAEARAGAGEVLEIEVAKGKLDMVVRPYEQMTSHAPSPVTGL